MASDAAATHPKTLPSLPESALHTSFGGTWFDGVAAPWNLFEPASQARLASAAKVHAPAAVRSPLPHQLGYDDGEDEAHVHVRLHNMPSGARVRSSASGATLHIDAGKGAKTHAGSTHSGTGSPGDPAFEIATHQFTGGMAGTSVHPANPHSAGANIAHRVPQKSAPQAASAPASPWSLDSLLHLPGKLIVAAATYEGRGLDTEVDAAAHAVLSVGEKLGLVKASAAPKPSGPRKPGTFEQFNHAFASTVVGGVENMIGGLWKMESYAYQHPIDFYTGVGKRLLDLQKWEFNTDKKILTAAYHATVESTTAKGRRQLWNDGVRTWHDSVRTAEGLWNRTSNTVSNAYKTGTLPTLAGHAAGEVFLVVAPALVGAPEASAARIGGSLAVREAAEIGAKTVLKEAATGTEAGVAKGAAEVVSPASKVLPAADAGAAAAPAEDVDAYVAKLYSKATPTSKASGRFEVEQTGPRNYRVEGGDKAVDIDGYNGNTILEAKYVGNASRSPYVEGSKIPDFLRTQILAEQQDEFERFGAVISDPAVPFTDLNVLTNEPAAAPYFEKLMNTNKIPGKVSVVPTKVH
jgi:hypothetical protein